MTDTDHRGAAPSGFHRPSRGALVVALLAVLVYANSLRNGFALDDVPIIRDNVEVHGLASLPDAVSGSYWPQNIAPSAYRPLTLATYAVDWQIWGGRAVGFHLVNILLHAAASVLVFLLLGQLGLGVLAATAGAAVFAVHPVHVEAVANIVGRAEILAALFYLGAGMIYLRKGPGWLSAVIVALLYLLSLLSKEMGATLPAALLLLEAYRRPSLREAAVAALHRWRTYLLASATFVGYMALRAANLQRLIGNPGAAWFADTAPGSHVWTAIRIVPEYLRLMLWPVELAADYGPATIVPEQSPLAPLVLLGFLMALLLARVVYIGWSKARPLALGILWFAVTILPVAGLLFATGVILAERTLYLPSVGLAMVVAAGFAWLRARRAALVRPVTAVLVIAIAAAGVRTWIHNPIWRDTRTVLRHLAATHPSNYRAQWWFADQLYDQGEVEASLDHMQLALRMVPGYFNLRMFYGMRLLDEGYYPRAEAQFDTARHAFEISDRAHAYYVRSLIAQQEPGRAIAASDTLVERFPDSPDVWAERARALALAAEHDAALAAIRRAIRVARPELRWRHVLVQAGIQRAAADSAAARSAYRVGRAAAPPDADVPPLDELGARVRTGGIPFEEW